MSCPANQALRWKFQQDPDRKLGFAVYRCTYGSGSDEEWQRFMAYLDTSVRAALAGEELDGLCDRLDWAVQEDEQLHRAKVDVVRQRFQAWIPRDVEKGGWGGSRHHACIMVEQADVDDVLDFVNKPAAEQRKGLPGPCVTLVSARDGDEDDECEPYTRIDIAHLIPSAYTLLDGPGWLSIYNVTRP